MFEAGDSVRVKPREELINLMKEAKGRTLAIDYCGVVCTVLGMANDLLVVQLPQAIIKNKDMDDGRRTLWKWAFEPLVKDKNYYSRHLLHGASNV